MPYKRREGADNVEKEINSCGSDKENKKKKFHFDNPYFCNPQPYDHILMFQTGDISCEGGYSIGEHRQICYEISYIVSGEGMFYINDKAYRVKKGDICLNVPGERHDGLADFIDPFRFFYLGFGFCEAQEGNPLIPVKKMFDRVETPVLQDRYSIQIPFMGIFNEIINRRNYAGLMIKSHLDQIIVAAYRNFFESLKRQYEPENGRSKSKRIVYEIINHIDMNLSNLSDLSGIAKELGYSYPYLSRVFSHEVGCSIQEYFNKKRFEKSIGLIRNSSLSVTQIAESLSFQSIHSFSRAFRKYFGLSPTEYQALYNQEPSKKIKNEQ